MVTCIGLGWISIGIMSGGLQSENRVNNNTVGKGWGLRCGDQRRASPHPHQVIAEDRMASIEGNTKT